MTRPEPAADQLARVLHATGPAAVHAEELMLFGQFVGSWTADWTGIGSDGRSRRLTGQVVFGWILGGRAIQDTWTVPGPEQWADGDPPLGFRGTTIRFYDRRLGAWRSTWIDPPNGRVRRFVGRPADDGIVLLSDEETPHLRWRFSEITPETFRWQAEIIRAGVSRWEPHQDARLRRTS